MARTLRLKPMQNQWGETLSRFRKRLVESDKNDKTNFLGEYSRLSTALQLSGITPQKAWQQAHKRYPPKGYANEEGPVKWGQGGCPPNAAADCIRTQDPGGDIDHTGIPLSWGAGDQPVSQGNPFKDLANRGKQVPAQKVLSPSDYYLQLTRSAEGKTSSRAEAIQWAADNSYIPLNEIGIPPTPEAVRFLQFARDKETSADFTKRRLPTTAVVENKTGMEDSGRSTIDVLTKFSDAVEKMGGSLV